MVNKGYQTSAPRITRIMKEMGLVCRTKQKKFNYNFTGNMMCRKNIINRQFNQDEPNKAWACDITHIHLNYKPYYSCKVSSYKISSNQKTPLIIDTFIKAYSIRNPQKGLIFHSD